MGDALWTYSIYWIVHDSWKTPSAHAILLLGRERERDRERVCAFFKTSLQTVFSGIFKYSWCYFFLPLPLYSLSCFSAVWRLLYILFCALPLCVSCLLSSFLELLCPKYALTVDCSSVLASSDMSGHVLKSKDLEISHQWEQVALVFLDLRYLTSVLLSVGLDLTWKLNVFLLAE